MYLACVSTVTGSAFAQRNVWHEPAASLKSSVIELAFPRSAPTKKVEAILILRFAPSFSPELQIAITLQPDHVATAEYRWASISSSAVFRKMAGHPTAASVVTGMKIQRSMISIPRDLATVWLRQFWLELEKTSAQFSQELLSHQITLDGTKYYCEYDEYPKHFVVEMQASEVEYETPQDPSLVKWMNEIRRTVRERAVRQ